MSVCYKQLKRLVFKGFFTYYKLSILNIYIYIYICIYILYIYIEGLPSPLKNFSSNLKFTHEKSKSSVNFLEVSVSIADNKLETALFCKSTDGY